MANLPSNHDLLGQAVNAAVAAGEAILRLYADAGKVEYKADASPLTAADRAAHAAILATLGRPAPTARTGEPDRLSPGHQLVGVHAAACPMEVPMAHPQAYPVLSEEGSEMPVAERTGWPRFWLVDPLDGTKEFLKRNGEFTVNIALIENGYPVLGVVLAPVSGALYAGIAGTGAWKAQAGRHYRSAKDLVAGAAAPDSHWQRLSRGEVPGGSTALYEVLPGVGRAGSAEASPSRPLAPSGKNDWRANGLVNRADTNDENPGNGSARSRPVRVVASRSHLNEETRTFIAELEAEHGRAELVSIGSSLKLCLIAEGAADVYPRLAPTMEWDTAAGQAVVEAAGGTVVDHSTGQRVRYNKPNLLNPFFVAYRPGWSATSSNKGE